MTPGRATALLICSMAVAAATTPESAAQTQRETVISANCVLAIGTAVRMLQRDFLLHEPAGIVESGFNDTFQRYYSSISCYEDAEGFVLNFRPPEYAAGVYGRGVYMVRMDRTHQIEYATPLR